MSDKGLESHKRSKSSRALALLHRERTKEHVESRSNLGKTSSEAGSSTGSLNSQVPSNAPPSAPVPSLRSRAGLSTNIPPGGDSSSNLVPPSPIRSNASSSAQLSVEKGASIEQSVRTFRIFEALRSGDTAAIARGIKETASGGIEDGEARPSTSSVRSHVGPLEGTTILHLAIQCADVPVVEFVVSTAATGSDPVIDINARDRDGNTPLHLAAMLGRPPVVKLLLAQSNVNDSVANYQGRLPIDLARTPDIFQQLQLSRSLFFDSKVKEIQALVANNDYEALGKVLEESRVQTVLDLNSGELVTDPTTVHAGGTLLHEAARKRDLRLIETLLLHGADPFRRDKKGKLPQEVTKDDKTKAMLKRSPAAVAAQRGIQEKAVLGNANAQAVASSGQTSAADSAVAGKEGREMKGYLKKWTNYTGGYKLRWFVLEDGVLSYYKHQDDAGSACRGAINMRIAKLWMDPQDKQRFEILGKSSVKYHLKANHDVEAKRWYWALNNAIQWAKDEAREEQRKKVKDEELFRQAKHDQRDKTPQKDQDASQGHIDPTNVHRNRSSRYLVPASSIPISGSRVTFGGTSTAAGSVMEEDGTTAYGSYEHSMPEMGRVTSYAGTATIEGDVDDDEEYGDDASSHEAQPASKDAFNITAQSARLQLDLLAQVSAALQAEKSKNPTLPISHPTVVQAVASYENAVRSLNGLVGDLLKISRDRDAYWQYRLDREADVRRLWEDNMARLAKEQEALEGRMGESEDKRKRTKRALREVLEFGTSQPPSRGGEQPEQVSQALRKLEVDGDSKVSRRKSVGAYSMRRKSTIAQMTNLSDSEEDDDEEFFDAVDAGEVQVVEDLPPSATSPPAGDGGTICEIKRKNIQTSFRGYEDPIREKLKMDADDRPKISLWSILKSMIGKDMTKMTLPVSFNEPTSLLQRVAEDMEYTDLLDTAADRGDSTERMVYVAAFAASEYASTIGRVAKPFNPLLGETYEYVRPDKGYRFFIEQVSHHPPIGAAYAESPKWDYYGESAVKSKFYGKSFDINPLGTWFLKLRPTNGAPEELYTWKKVTSSVVGIITGSPTVDNYGPMEVRNWSTNEVCHLDFKQRGWRASSAYEVKGKVLDADGTQRWSIGGHWNSKIYARLTPGYDAVVTPPHGVSAGPSSKPTEVNQAFLVWEAHKRPTGIPFNLTPFVLTLNALPERLRPLLPPTDTRLRPDQRAMEDGEYDFAAMEKNRVEEKQRAKRREREEKGEEFESKWFTKGRCTVTGEDYWIFGGEYWRSREEGRWDRVEDIF